MELKAYMYYDKVDKVYLDRSIVFSRSERAVCRGYLQSFEQDKRMNPKEYELRFFGTFDDESGKWSLLPEPSVVDVMQVYEKIPDTQGKVVEV